MEMFGSRLSAMTVVLIEARKAIIWNDWDNSELFQHLGAETWYCDLLVLRPHSVLTILNSLPSHPVHDSASSNALASTCYYLDSATY